MTNSINGKGITALFLSYIPAFFGMFYMFICANLRAGLISVAAAAVLFGASAPVSAEQIAAAAPTPKKVAILIFDGVQKAYAADGLWSPGSFHMASSGPLKAGLSFDDQDGHHWQGALTVEPTAGDAHQFLVRLVTARAS